MRLLKTHSHTSNGLAMEPETREKKQLMEAQTLQQGESHPSKTCRVQPVWRGRGAEKALEPAAYRQCGGGGAGKDLRQTNHRNCTMARRALVDMEGNTGSNKREKSCEKTSAGHRHGGGLDEETTNTCGMEGGRTYSPARAGSVQPKKQSRPNTTRKKKKDDTQART